jgi:hypothetical protein
LWGACLWSNSDSKLSQEINAQDGTSNSCLQKTGSKKSALKLDSFGNAPWRRGLDGLVFDAHGILLNVAPMSTKYLSLVNLSVRKISPAFPGKGMAVAVACAGVAEFWFSNQAQGCTHL